MWEYKVGNNVNITNFVWKKFIRSLKISKRTEIRSTEIAMKCNKNAWPDDVVGPVPLSS